jgi:hypothetical protein
VKLRIIVLMLCGVAGAGASFAFASGGAAHGRAAPWCRHQLVFGTASAPQTFTVTLTRSWRHNDNVKTGQPVQVTLGSSGQTVRFTGVGCVGSDGTLTVTEAGFQVVQPRTRGGDGGQTTTTTSNDGTTTTDGDSPPTTTNGDHPPTTTNNNPPPTTTNNNTTTSTNPSD